VNDELKRLWKEAAVAQCKVLSQYLLGVSEKTTKNLSQDSRSPGRNLNTGPSE
jgi:hypothetical protein